MKTKTLVPIRESVARVLSITFIAALAISIRGADAAEWDNGPCSGMNGDVNGDTHTNVSDVITLLSHLFLGAPNQLAPACQRHGTMIAATGQALCYNRLSEREWHLIPCDSATCPGQDAAYALGCPTSGRFLDNGDGTVTDTCTGLMWQQDTADTNGDGSRDELDVMTWCGALRYCEELRFAGYEDWRLPNVRELESLIDYGNALSAIPSKLLALNESYWSSTPAMTDPMSAWSVSFTTGSIFFEPVEETIVAMHVRAVRQQLCSAFNGDVNADGSADIGDAIQLLQHLFLGSHPQLIPYCVNLFPSALAETGATTCYADGTAEDCDNEDCPVQDAAVTTGCPTSGRFLDNGDGTVTDTCTGLMWQQDTADTNGDGSRDWPSDLETWCGALKYCEELRFAGYEDWRLPNVRELESLVHYGAENGIDSVFRVTAGSYWSSTTDARSTNAAWYLFSGGGSGTNGKDVVYFVRATRGD